jgi:hypothetical protein
MLKGANGSAVSPSVEQFQGNRRLERSRRKMELEGVIWMEMTSNKE